MFHIVEKMYTKMNKKGQIPEGLVGLLAVALIIFALSQFNAYRNNLAQSAYDVAGIEQVYMSEENFKQIVRNGLEGIAEENKNREDKIESDDEFIKRRFKDFVENEISKRESNKQELSLTQLKQLKAYLESDRVVYNFDANSLEAHIPEIIFEYGIEKIFDESYKGKEITLVYRKDFSFYIDT